MSVTGLDLSLTCSGLARIYPSGEIATWTVKSKGHRNATLQERALRIRHLARDICQGLDFQEMVVLEAPSYGSSGAGTWDRCGLWWQVVEILSQREVPVALVAPTSVKKFISGSGRADKALVRDAVERLFPQLKGVTFDEADSACMALLAALKQGYAVPKPSGWEQALTKIQWPANDGSSAWPESAKEESA